MKAATTRTALAFAAVLVMFNSSSMARLNATPRSASFKNNGSFVEIEGRLPDGCTSFYLHAAKNGVGSGATTFLYHHGTTGARASGLLTAEVTSRIPH